MKHPTIEQVAAFLSVATDEEIHKVLHLAWPDHPLTDTKEIDE
ncbi:hypothetical protein Rruber_01223 [Rhodococcus ruber]